MYRLREPFERELDRLVLALLGFGDEFFALGFAAVEDLLALGLDLLACLLESFLSQLRRAAARGPPPPRPRCRRRRTLPI